MERRAKSIEQVRVLCACSSSEISIVTVDGEEVFH